MFVTVKPIANNTHLNAIDYMEYHLAKTININYVLKIEQMCEEYTSPYLVVLFTGERFIVNYLDGFEIIRCTRKMSK